MCDHCPFCGTELTKKRKCPDCKYQKGTVEVHTFLTYDDGDQFEVIRMTDDVLLDNQGETVYDELSDEGTKDVFYVGGPDQVQELIKKLKNQPILQ
jgi:hypothetical protein